MIKNLTSNLQGRRKFSSMGVAFLLLLPLVLGGVACGSKGKKKTPKAGDKIYPVSVIKIGVEEIPNTLELKGNFVPSDKLDVKTEMEGKVISVAVSEGQQVAVGEPLASLNPESLNLLLEKQKLELKETEAKIEAGQPLRAPGGRLFRRPGVAPGTPENGEVPEAEEQPPPAVSPPRPLSPDEVGESPPSEETPPAAGGGSPEKPEAVVRAEEATLDRIKAEIALTEKKIESANLTAGIAGMIAKKNITDGSVVNAGDILFEIVRIDPIILSIYMPKESVGLLQKEQRVDVVAEDLPDQTLSGEIVFIAPEPDAQNKNYEVKISISNTQLKLKGGMAGKSLLPLGQVKKALLVPEDAVISKDNKKYVYVVNDQVADRKEVELGKKVGGKFEVKSGLKEGETVVLKGQATFDEEQEFVKIESL